MNASDLSNYPMPDLTCPTWCTSDHATEWDQFVRVTFWDQPIPAEGGGFLPKRERTDAELDEWLATWAPEVLHVGPLGKVSFGFSEGATVEIQQGWHGTAEGYVAAEGPLSASTARQFAALLLNAADELDRMAATA